MNQAQSVAPLRQQSSTIIQRARVQRIAAGQCILEISRTYHEAQIAFSCLVMPQKGDTVFYITDDEGEYFVLGVLAREGEQHVNIQFPADVTLSAQGGDVSILSAETITLLAEQLSQAADKTVYQAETALLDVKTLFAKGSRLQANYERIRTVAGVLNNVARQSTQQFKEYIRHTQEMDQVSSRHMSRYIRGLFSVNSKHTVLLSKKDTKIDGEHLHLG